MRGKDAEYCRGCDYLGWTGGEKTCDYGTVTGKARLTVTDAPPGVGCPLHTGKRPPEEKRKKKEAAPRSASLTAPAPQESPGNTPVAQRRKKPDRAPFDELRAMQLYEEGVDDVAMADALGITEKRVQNWRLRMHLKRPKGGQKRKKEKETSMSRENENARRENEEKMRETASIPQQEAEASYRQVSELPKTQAFLAEAEGTQQTEASENAREERELMTAELLLGLCERIAAAGLGKLPLRINGRDVRDFAVIALVKTPDGAIIEMTN